MLGYVLMSITSKKKILGTHWMDNPIFYGKVTKLYDQSLNGPQHVTNDFLV